MSFITLGSSISSAYLRLIREDIQGQGLLSGIHKGDGFLQGLHGENGKDRAKDLLLHEDVRFINIHQHCRSYGETGMVGEADFA